MKNFIWRVGSLLVLLSLGLEVSANQSELIATIIPVTGNIDEFFAIDSKYIKDWQIRFVTPEYGAEALQLGIRKDTLLNGAMYQMVERGDNQVTVDYFYYREVGEMV